jgi:aquaporin Z
MFSRQRVAQLVAEFLGTGTLAVAVYSMMARTNFPLFSGVAAGLVLALMVFAIGSFSGAHINPAVTFGLWTVRKINTLQAVTYIVAQFLGALAAWALLKYFLGTALESTAGKFVWKAFIAEAVGAAVFTFGLVAAVYQKYVGGQLAFTMGVSLTIGILVASMAANGIVNPAVAVGVQSWNWAYATAPFAGALVGSNLYALLFAADYPQLRRRTARASVTSVKSKSSRSTARKTTTRKAPARRRR